MKPFNLEAALAGAPVQLRGGGKARVFFNTNDAGLDIVFPLVGAIDGKTGIDTWRIDGSFIRGYYKSDLDIIGMWEEPKLTSEQVLEKAYQEKLPLDAIGKKAFVIAKTKDGDYVMQCGEDNLYFASHETEWEFYKEPAPKLDTITVTLPKPFKPKEGGVYYSIGGYHNGTIVKMQANCMTDISILNGNCFRAESDAQAWLNAMKNALDD